MIHGITFKLIRRTFQSKGQSKNDSKKLNQARGKESREMKSGDITGVGNKDTGREIGIKSVQ